MIWVCLKMGIPPQILWFSFHVKISTWEKNTIFRQPSGKPLSAFSPPEMGVVAMEPNGRSLAVSNNKNIAGYLEFGLLVQNMGLSENSVPLHPMVNDHYPY